jgi:hypothetical protein
MRSARTRARLVSDKPLDLNKHRGMAEQKTTDIRRILADVENKRKGPARSAEGTRKPTFVGSGRFLAGGSRQGALCFEFVRRGSDWRVARYAG